MIYNYLCNQCLSPLKLWVRTRSWRGVLNTTLCDKVCQWLATGQWFSTDPPVSSTNKTDCHDISGILGGYFGGVFCKKKNVFFNSSHHMHRTRQTYYKCKWQLLLFMCSAHSNFFLKSIVIVITTLFQVEYYWRQAP